MTSPAPRSRRLDALSRRVSHALRHDPGAYGLRPDDDGWVAVEDLLAGLNEHGNEAPLTLTDLEAMVSSASAGRHEMEGARIRARYGHSAVGLDPVRARPPSRLFHGTTPASVPRIQAEGLRPMGRRHVHLAIEPERARTTGSRRSDSPVVIRVDAAAADREGVAFYQASAEVWLADEVPARFLAVGDPGTDDTSTWRGTTRP